MKEFLKHACLVVFLVAYLSWIGYHIFEEGKTRGYSEGWYQGGSMAWQQARELVYDQRTKVCEQVLKEHAEK